MSRQEIKFGAKKHTNIAKDVFQLKKQRRRSVAKIVNQIEFKKYTGEEYHYQDLLQLYIEKTQPISKRPLDDFVANIDDLGPELILNLKLIDMYRYPSE